ncbi:MAG: SPOR domain-containing protein [Legionella sp.]
MKLVIDEKLKHRLVGVAVILSLGAIFLPAMMKKSSQRLENNFSVNVELPPKPSAPNVAMTDEKEVFKTIKVAKIESTPIDEKGSDFGKEDFIQSVQVADDAIAPVAKIEPKTDVSEAVAKPIELALSNAAQNVVKKQIKVAANTVTKPAVKIKPKVIKKQPVVAQAKAKRVLNNKGVYAVQLASFARLDNAKSLVNKLRNKGYKANFTKIVTKQGVTYKVYAGHSPVRSDVIKLKTQLASAMQLNGFVVNTEVS